MAGRGRSDRDIAKIGAISLVVALLAMAAALNLQKFPGFRGTSYTAELSDASGLHEGNMVQIAGVRVGRIGEIDLAKDHVVVHFTIDGGHRFGKESTATVEVLNMLGEKFLDLRPQGEEEMPEDGTIPLSQTRASYDIVKVFNRLADTTEQIDIPQLQRALDAVSDTMNRTSDEASATFDGLTRLSTTIASRDAELQELLQRSHSVSQLLADRKGDIVDLLKNGDLVLQELHKRREAVHDLLRYTARLSAELGGLVDDNQRQIGPMLAELRKVTQNLLERKGQLQAVIHKLGPYTRILSNVIGTGPWFDAYAVNFFALPSGEFQPEKR